MEWFLGSLALLLNTASMAGGRDLANHHVPLVDSRGAFNAPGQPIPRSPTPSPLPSVSGASPFPHNLRQEVALLKARGRFLYNGNSLLPEIALSFDDGPNPPYTSQILATLQRHGIKATFFCIGSHIATYPALAQQEVAEGHLVGSHTWSHAYLPTLPRESVTWQLTAAAQAITRATGISPTLFRPPYGAYDSNVLVDTNTLDLTTVLWNVDPHDWSRPGADTILAHVVSQTHNGSIILLHDGGGDRSQTVTALPHIIEQLQQRNLRFVTIQQLINHLHFTSLGAGVVHAGKWRWSMPVEQKELMLPSRSFVGSGQWVA